MNIAEKQVTMNIYDFSVRWNVAKHDTKTLAIKSSTLKIVDKDVLQEIEHNNKCQRAVWWSEIFLSMECEFVKVHERWSLICFFPPCSSVIL